MGLRHVRRWQGQTARWLDDELILWSGFLKPTEYPGLACSEMKLASFCQKFGRSQDSSMQNSFIHLLRGGLDVYGQDGRTSLSSDDSCDSRFHGEALSAGMPNSRLLPWLPPRLCPVRNLDCMPTLPPPRLSALCPRLCPGRVYPVASFMLPPPRLLSALLSLLCFLSRRLNSLDGL